jgi:HEAT repeat protein
MCCQSPDRWNDRVSLALCGILLFGLLEASFASAAIQGAKTKKPAHAVKISDMDQTRQALGLPVENRIHLLTQQGPVGYRNLVAIMFDEKGSMDQRWRAVTAVGRIGGESSKPDLEKALKSNEWFMRNAALVAILNVDQGRARQWARQLISDDSLIVRAAAVGVLGELKDETAVPLLWEKLYSKENYAGQQSLFIRRKIVETLGKLETKGQEAKFAQILNDSDESLHPPAMDALEHLTNKKMKRTEWQRWLKAQAGSTQKTQTHL